MKSISTLIIFIFAFGIGFICNSLLPNINKDPQLTPASLSMTSLNSLDDKPRKNSDTSLGLDLDTQENLINKYKNQISQLQTENDQLRDKLENLSLTANRVPNSSKSTDSDDEIFDKELETIAKPLIALAKLNVPFVKQEFEALGLEPDNIEESFDKILENPVQKRLSSNIISKTSTFENKLNAYAEGKFYLFKKSENLAKYHKVVLDINYQASDENPDRAHGSYSLKLQDEKGNQYSVTNDKGSPNNIYYTKEENLVLTFGRDLMAHQVSEDLSRFNVYENNDFIGIIVFD